MVGRLLIGLIGRLIGGQGSRIRPAEVVIRSWKEARNLNSYAGKPCGGSRSIGIQSKKQGKREKEAPSYLLVSIIRLAMPAPSTDQPDPALLHTS